MTAMNCFSCLSFLRPQRLAKPFIAGTMAIALAVSAASSVAGDPFRSNNPKAIGDQTEAAFRTMFEYGNYTEASELLETAEADEPMAYAMRASIAYLEEDWATLGNNATRTREVAETLVETDPLRGHLYVAVGHFLEGAHILVTEGTLRGAPRALLKLQRTLSNLERAEAVDSMDPELNLIKGFMDLMVALYLPLAEPEDAIARLRTYAAPTYISQRGIAIACRDIDDHDCAVDAIEAAIAAAPDNPDLQYLKAQVWVNLGDDEGSLEFFDIALDHEDNFPIGLRNQIAFERCRANVRATGENANCGRLLNREE
jgi:tetratricopeptide (TPR) repeat protein